MAANYRILSQEQTSDIAPGGKFRELMEVTFEVPGAGTGKITIPIELYSEDAVRDAVESRAQAMIAVANL